MQKNKYILETDGEFERLEYQAQTGIYDHQEDLNNVLIPKEGVFCDVGCGSGIVARFLAQSRPKAKVYGMDFSDLRVHQAKKYAPNKACENLGFLQGNILKMPFSDNQFDFVFCRYVLHHLGRDQLVLAMKEVLRCLKPGGTVCFVDVDGVFLNVFPQTESMEHILNKLEASQQIDLNVGRKILPTMEIAGFKKITSRLRALDFNGKERAVEQELNQGRFLGFKNFLLQLTNGNERLVDQFVKEFLSTMIQPNAVYFYNRFIVTGKK